MIKTRLSGMVVSNDFLLGEKTNVSFDVYAQGIHSRSGLYNGNDSNSVDGIELVFRPKNMNTDLFYNTISDVEHISTSRGNFNWIYDNVSFIKEKYMDITFISINIEVSSIYFLKNELMVLSDKLNESNIKLIVEITKRERFFSKPTLKSIYELHDEGVIFAIDDVSMNEMLTPVFNLSVFMFIKIKMHAYCSIINKHSFIDKMIKNNKKLIIEHVESNEQFMKLALDPIPFFQGYFLCTPKIIGSIINN